MCTQLQGGIYVQSIAYMLEQLVPFYAAVIILTRFNIKANEAQRLADNMISLYIHLLM